MFALMLAASLLLAACGGAAPTTAPEATEAPAAEEIGKPYDGQNPPAAGQELTDALAG